MTVGANEDVRRLQIAVDDEIGVRVRDGVERPAGTTRAACVGRGAVRRRSGRCGCRPRTRERGMAGRVEVTPASRRRAMCGCARRASSVPSRWKRSSPRWSSRARLSSLTATNPSKRPSLRRARHTVPMPPIPRGASRVYGPTACPAREGPGRSSVGTGDSRKSEPTSQSCSVRSRATIGARSGRVRARSASQAARASASSSSASSSSGLSARQ